MSGLPAAGLIYLIYLTTVRNSFVIQLSMSLSVGYVLASALLSLARYYQYQTEP